MNRTIRKWFWVWDEDKEKAFLEDVALKGYKLVRVGFGKYTFEDGNTKKLAYQFDFKGFSKMKEKEYLQLYEDAGWNFTARFGNWYYFSREVNEGEQVDLSLFNNNESRGAKYRRLLAFLLIVGFPLYYQVIFTFPNMSGSKLEFPGFYFFLRIIVLIFTGLHAIAVLKIAIMYRKMKSSLSE